MTGQTQTDRTPQIIVPLYYESTLAKNIEEYPHASKIITVPVYWDENLVTTAGTITFESNAAMPFDSKSLERIGQFGGILGKPQHISIATLVLDNGFTIIYSYLRDGTENIYPSIIYGTGVFAENNITINRTYLTDKKRKVDFIWQ